MSADLLDPEHMQRRAAESITGDPGLRDELTDEEARPLIDWALAQAAALARRAAQTASAEGMDASLGDLRKIMKRINRVIGCRTAGDVDGLRGSLDRLRSLSSGLFGQDFPPGPEELESFLAMQEGLTNEQVIARLLAMFAPPPAQLTAPPAPDQLTAPPQPEQLAAPPAPDQLAPPPERQRLSAPETPDLLPYTGEDTLL